MKLKLTLVTHSGEQDLLVTTDGTASVGDVARELATVQAGFAWKDGEAELAQEHSQQLTIKLSGSATQQHDSLLIDPDTPIAEAPIRSGSRVAVVGARGMHGHLSGENSAVVAQLTVQSGPNAGQTFPLRSGMSIVGRDSRLSDVTLDDSYISKRHVRIAISDVIEVIDLGSANGTWISGRQVQRAEIHSSDRVAVGGSVFTITSVGKLVGQHGPTLSFNRPPVVMQPYQPTEIEAPALPKPYQQRVAPFFVLLTPILIVGALLLVINFTDAGRRFSIFTIVFFAMSPLMFLGSFLDQRRQGRIEEKRDVKVFWEEIADVTEELVVRAERERASRLIEAPSTVDGITAIRNQSAQLWSRRTDRPYFLDVRLGLGRVVSRTAIRPFTRNGARQEYWDAVCDLRDQFAFLDDAPVVASLSRAGGIGVSGPQHIMHPVARALVIQAAALHSPAELSIVALSGSDSRKEWEWLKWLPHVASAHCPVNGSVSLAGNAVNAERLVADLEELIITRSGGNGSGEDDETKKGSLPALLVIVLPDVAVDRSRLVRLAEDGREHGLHFIWCSPNHSGIPAACRAFVQFDDAAIGWSGQVHLDEIVSPIVCESVSAEDSLTIARSIAPIVDTGARSEDESDLPTSMSILSDSAYGSELASSPDNLLERWKANDPTLVGQPLGRSGVSLRAMVGQGPSDAVALDLGVHGPHALVGGTTGAGKSEFLQTWVLAMAANNSPRRLTFLFVDYKGGAAFARCTDLPHSVGIITDLDQHLVRRALESLRAELVHREQILARYRVKDIHDLDRHENAQILPRLIIVVDEFAALVSEVPDFIEGVVDIAQRGRSLGIHLILATQQPSGVIKGSLRANTNLRVALRMADSSDSNDVIGDKRAATFDPAIPGRAAAKTGPGRVTVFQSLFSGGVTTSMQQAPDIQIETFGFGESQRVHRSVFDAELAGKGQGMPDQSDLGRVVDQMLAANHELQLPEPRRPWLPVLADLYAFEKIAQRTDTELAFGIQDIPKEQRDQVVHFYPDDDGNMAVIGTGGAGKSTLLRTLAIASAGTLRGGPCDVYGIDMGAGGLAMIEALPHVGSVISGADRERVQRLLRWLRELVEDRTMRYSQVNAATITQYRAQASRPDERRILVLIDGFGAFRQEYEHVARGVEFMQLSQMISDGRSVGVHFVLSADRPGVIPMSLRANIQRNVIMRLSNPDDYAMLHAPRDVLNADSPPGRALVDGLEAQIAVLGGTQSLSQQASKIEHLATVLRSLNRAEAMPIMRMPERISIDELPASIDGRVTVGMDGESLQPYAIEPSGSYLVVGPPHSGKTATLAALTASVRRAYSGAQMFLIGSARTTLRNAAQWKEIATTSEEIQELALRLQKSISSGSIKVSSDVPILLVVEALDLAAGESYEAALAALVKCAILHGVFVVGECDISTLGRSYALGPLFKQARRGIALQPNIGDGESAFKTEFPRVNSQAYPPGRGVAAERGRAHVVQVVVTD